MKDGDVVAADLSDPDLFELWIASDSDDTFEEWAEKRCGVQSACFSVAATSTTWFTESGHRARIDHRFSGDVIYSVEPIR